MTRIAIVFLVTLCVAQSIGLLVLSVTLNRRIDRLERISTANPIATIKHTRGEHVLTAAL